MSENWAKSPRLTIRLTNSDSFDFPPHRSPTFSSVLETIVDECLVTDSNIHPRKVGRESTESLQSLPLLLPDDSGILGLEAELQDEIENHKLSKAKILNLSDELESMKFELEQKQNRIRGLKAMQKESVDRSLYEECQMELETTRDTLAATLMWR